MSSSESETANEDVRRLPSDSHYAYLEHIVTATSRNIGLVPLTCRQMGLAAAYTDEQLCYIRRDGTVWATAAGSYYMWQLRTPREVRKTKKGKNKRRITRRYPGVLFGETDG
jgi:hypothetical protein